MKLTNKLPIIIVTACISALLIWAFLGGRKELALEQEREQPVKPASRLSVEDGKSVVTLDKATRIKSGIVITPLQIISRQEKLKAYGTVLQIQDLIDLYNTHIAARARVEKVRANLDASRKEYERLKALYEDNQNISAKALQAAEAAWRSDEANARAAQDALHAIEASVRQRWGDVITGWMIDSSPSFNHLIQRRSLLIQITLPQDTHLTPAPQTALVPTADGKLVSAKLVSPSPQTDPRIQGMSFFYIASTQPGLLPGMNVIAYLPVGSRAKGVVVPDPAVVWQQGKAWVYVQQGDYRFVRTEISTETPVKNGWFISKELTGGERVVVNGSQLLLSEESRSHIQVGD